uniref:Uncharacterized protein n=1 Tax=Romanomermis culicivorax TaxID=13658 RepID=A0A915HST6_ROMCU
MPKASKKYYDQKACEREISVNNLILLVNNHIGDKIQWDIIGPFIVTNNGVNKELILSIIIESNTFYQMFAKLESQHDDNGTFGNDGGTISDPQFSADEQAKHLPKAVERVVGRACNKDSFKPLPKGREEGAREGFEFKKGPSTEFEFRKDTIWAEDH